MAVLMNHHELTETAIVTVDLAERIESVKAGLLGAMAGGLVFGAATLVNGLLAPHVLAPNVLSLASLQRDVAMFTVISGAIISGAIISGAIVLLSGFLFGVTYRYIIRQDQNLHLRSGAVLAFGLVRGLALVEERLQEPIALLPLVILGIESLVLFAGVRLVLDGALAAGWVKPFGTSQPFSSSPATAPLDKRQSSSSHGIKSSNSG